MDRQSTPPLQAVFPLTPPPTHHKGKTPGCPVSQRDVSPCPISSSLHAAEQDDTVLVDGLRLPALIYDAVQPTAPAFSPRYRVHDPHSPSPSPSSTLLGSPPLASGSMSHDDALRHFFDNIIAGGLGEAPEGGVVARAQASLKGVWWCQNAEISTHGSISASATSIQGSERATTVSQAPGRGQIKEEPLFLDDESEAEEGMEDQQGMGLDDLYRDELVYVRTERSQALVRNDPSAKMVTVRRRQEDEVMIIGSSSGSISKRSRVTVEDDEEDEEIEYTGSLYPSSKRHRRDSTEDDCRSSTPIREAVKCGACGCRCGGQAQNQAAEVSSTGGSRSLGAHRSPQDDVPMGTGKITWSKSLPRHVLGNILHSLLNEGGSLRTKWGNKTAHWAQLAEQMGARGGDHDRVRNAATRMQQALPSMMRRGLL